MGLDALGKLGATIDTIARQLHFSVEANAEHEYDSLAIFSHTANQEKVNAQASTFQGVNIAHEVKHQENPSSKTFQAVNELLLKDHQIDTGMLLQFG